MYNDFLKIIYMYSRVLKSWLTNWISLVRRFIHWFMTLLSFSLLFNDICTSISVLYTSYTPELGTMRCPPRELKEPKAVQDGSRERTRLWVRRPMVSLSMRECASLGDSLDEKSESSSCGVTVPEELYTFIFRLGRGSSKGELVMGILSATSWRA